MNNEKYLLSLSIRDLEEYERKLRLIREIAAHLFEIRDSVTGLPKDITVKS